MAYSQDDALVSYPSDADYSADGTGQFRAVKRTATGVVLCGANEAVVLGILQNDPKTGEGATVKTQETSKAIAGAAVTVNARLATDAAGRLVAATSGQNVCAVALEAAAASGDQFAVRIRPGGVV